MSKKSRTEYIRKWKQTRFERGLCFRCGNPLDSEHQQCSVCRTKSLERHQQWYRRNKAAGLCCQCGNHPTMAGQVYCESCKAQREALRRQQYHSRKTAGICVYCHQNPIGSKSTVHCDDCFSKAHRREQHKRDRVNFGGNRKKVLARDNYRCRVCGSAKKLEVHHLNDSHLNDLDDLLVLCSACHMAVTMLAASANPDLIYRIVKERKQI